MGSNVLYSLSLLLVTAGLALLAASLQLARVARQHRQRMEHLLQLASEEIEPLQLPAAAWSRLAEAGWQPMARWTWSIDVFRAIPLKSHVGLPLQSANTDRSHIPMTTKIDGGLPAKPVEASVVSDSGPVRAGGARLSPGAGAQLRARTRERHPRQTQRHKQTGHSPCTHRQSPPARLISLMLFRVRSGVPRPFRRP